MAQPDNGAVEAPSLRQRRWRISANLLVQIVAVLAILVMVNWLASRHYARFDWTKTSYYALSEKTRQMLAALKQPVNVVIYLPEESRQDYIRKVLEDVRNLLKEFAAHGHGKLTVEYVAPDRQKAREDQLVAKYKLDSPDVVIFECGPRHKVVRVDDLVELEQANYTEPPRVKAFKAEGVFLSAIQTVTEEEPAKVYFLTGHGERDPESFDEHHGYSALAGYIKRDNLLVAKWNLLEKQALPADAAAMVIAGPRTTFTPVELNALQQYLRGNGRLMILLDPREESGLVKWLQDWGVQVDRNVLVAKGGLFGAEVLVADALGTEYAPHPITAKLAGINTDFPYARSVRRLERPGTATADQPNVTELVKTPKAFWGESDLNTDTAKYNPATDLLGPLPVAVAVESGRPSGVDLGIPLARLVVVGSSAFVDNSTLPTEAGNVDFFMNALNWLLHREQLAAVGPKVPQEFSLDMSVPQERAVWALTIVGLPLAVAAIGVAVWMRRRK